MRVKTGLLVLAALAIAVLPAVGDAIKTTGDVTYGFTADLTASPLVASDTLSANVYFTGQIDEFTKGYVQITYGKVNVLTSLTDNTPVSIPDIKLGAGYVTSDLGKFFKLGDIGLTVRGGYTSTSDNSYDSVTAYGSEDVGSAGVGTNWMFEIVGGYMDYINLKVGMDPAAANDWLVGLYSKRDWGFGPLGLEVFYDANVAATATDGLLVFDGEWLPVFGDITLDTGAGIRYDLGASALNWGAGFGASYTTMFMAEAGVFGNSTDALAGVVADLQITPIALIDFLAGMKLDTTAAATSTFTGADIAVRFNIGAADIYLGYLITSVGGGNVWAPVATTDGGLYFKITASF